MNCNDVSERLLDVVTAEQTVSVELQSHVSACEPCARKLREMRETMSLLDEWQVPEPSPYFDVRLQARLREERGKVRISWLHWLRKPIVGVAATVLLALGIGLYSVGGGNTSSPATNGQPVATSRGTAVGDLQYLEKHSDLLQNFEALDVLDSDSGGTAN